MAEFDVTNEDLEALAAKLESMREQFNPLECAALQAVWSLAASGFASENADVEGFVHAPIRTGVAPSSSVGEMKPISIGLNRSLFMFTLTLTPDKVEAGGERGR